MDARRVLSLCLIPVLFQMVGSQTNNTGQTQIHTTITSLQDDLETNSSAGNISLPSNDVWPIAYKLLPITDKLISVVSVLAIITNSFLILVIVMDPLKKLRKSKSTIIIVNIALADLLTGWATIFYANPVTPDIMPAYYFLNTGYTVSLLTLLIFTLERYIATMYPLKMKQLVTCGKTSLLCIVAWVAGAFVGNDGFYLRDHDITVERIRLARIFLLEFIVVAMLVLNVCIMISVHRHSRRFKDSRCSNSLVRKQRQLNIVLTILIVVFVLTVLPYLVFMQIYHILALFNEQQLYTTFGIFVRVFPRLFFPFGMLNYVVNPIVYAWRLYDYRSSVAALFCKNRAFSNRIQWLSMRRQSQSTRKERSSDTSQAKLPRRLRRRTEEEVVVGI